jgi:hypothetical protein
MPIGCTSRRDRQDRVLRGERTMDQTGGKRDLHEGERLLGSEVEAPGARCGVSMFGDLGHPFHRDNGTA